MAIMKELSGLLDQLREEAWATSQALLDAMADDEPEEAMFLAGRESALGFAIHQVQGMLEP